MVTGVLSLAERSIRTIMTPRSEMEWIDVNDSGRDPRPAATGPPQPVPGL
jgi:CBS domain containing-hemolysin-like protein